MRPGRLLAAALWGVLLCAAALAVEKPEWSKPFLKAPVPEGAYIAKADNWVVLHGEVGFSALADGRVVVSYRMVLGATQTKTRKLKLAIDYDEGTERLVEPQLLVPGAFGYKEVNLKRAGIDVPDTDDFMVESGRSLFLASRELLPDERAVVSWQVEDRGPYPGMSLFFPFHQYPMAELTVRTEPGAQPLALLYCEPQADGTTRISEGERTLRGLPARQRIVGDGDRWAPHATVGLPYFVACPEGRKGEAWAAVAARVAVFFEGANGPEDRAPVAEIGNRLAGAAASPRQKAAALCGFVQAMTYRNVAWGTGAYTPEPPRESLRTLSADCKGKVVLLRALLAQAGIESVPILCFSADEYLGRAPVHDAQPFNHVVIAIRLPGGETLPGALSSGPGAGWLLFDPTDPLAVLGGPPEGLEGTTGLWLGSPGDGFEIHTVLPAEVRSEVRLRFRVESLERATFDLTLEGFNPALREVASTLIWKEPAGRFQERCQKSLLGVVPGGKVESARYVPPDHGTGAPARLELSGSVPSPLQGLGGELHSCLSPAVLAGMAAGIPPAGYLRDEQDDLDEKVTPPEFCRMDPRFQGQTRHRKVEVRLEMPQGWTLAGGPSLRQPPRAPWLTLSVVQGPPWTVDSVEPRGIFEAKTEGARLADLNAAAALFRKPFLLKGPLEASKP